MAQQANVTLNTIVYTPNGTSNGVSSWANRAGGYGNSFTYLTEKFATPTKGDVVRMEFDLAVPIVATVDSDCSCAGGLLRTSTIKLSVWVPASSTAAERTDLWVRLKDLCASAPVSNGIQNLDPSWG
jgi:hypothetical protein